MRSVSQREPARLVLRYFAQSAWVIEFDPSAVGAGVTAIGISVDHPDIELEKPVVYALPSLEVVDQRRARLHVSMKLKDGVVAPTETVSGAMRACWTDVATGQPYWQVWSIRAGARENGGLDFVLGAPGAVETDGLGVWGVRRRILRFLRDRERAGDPPPRPDVIRNALQLELADLHEDLEFLANGGYVETRKWQYKGTVTILITSRGKEVARDDWPRGTDGVPGPVYHTTFNAEVKAAAVGNFGPTTQIVGDGQSELRQILDELRAALEQATGLPANTRDDGLDAVERISEELDREQPRRGRIETALRGLSIVADVAGTAQGAAMVTELVGKLTPHVHQVCQALT